VDAIREKAVVGTVRVTTERGSAAVGASDSVLAQRKHGGGGAFGLCRVCPELELCKLREDVDAMIAS
jgi:hypothetical protein